MNPQQPSAQSKPLRGNYVLLRADTLRLLLPQDEVGSALYLDEPPQASGMPGVFERNTEGGAQVVLALSKGMRPLTEYPGDRFVLTPMTTAQGELGFGWNEVTVLIDAHLHAQPLPTALVETASPLREFVEIDGHVVFCCNAARLADFAMSAEA
jgi:hypothetical protein